MLNKKRYVGIRAKIVAYTVICVVVVGLISNLFLYQYMQRIIEEKAESIDNLYASTIAAQLNYVLERVQTLNAYCANTQDAVDALRFGGMTSISARNAALTAQNTMNAYLRTSPIDGYINKLFIYSDNAIIAHAVSNYSGTPFDLQRLHGSVQYQRWLDGELRPFDGLYPSLNPGGANCLVLFSEIYAPNSNVIRGNVYVEIDPRIVTDILAPYNKVNRFFVQTATGGRLIPGEDRSLLDALPNEEEKNTFTYDGEQYLLKRYPLETPALHLSSCINQTMLLASDQDVLFSVVMVTLMIFSIATAIMVSLTHYITQPISRIMEKINRIALNDYSFDPELEKPNNEMGQVGARLNELGLAVQKLLDETVALHEERTEIEMALLQSQVNPHFLYNTLNSVHWMAVMQKNTGIEKVVRSLVSLLKNVSKGVSDKIPLTDELALLGDYVNIQSVRYMGAFDYLCKVPDVLREYRIIKFTLQPIVENAMLHGVVPKGTFGIITVDAYEDGDDLVITVTDDGVGMSPEEVETLFRQGDRPDKSSMSGIGVANVNRRLKLAYGNQYGISVESEKGIYTKVLVRIPKET